MEFEALIVMLAGKFPIVTLIASVLGMLVIVGQAVVMITPSKKDDEALAKFEAMPIVGPSLVALKKFAPIQKK